MDHTICTTCPLFSTTEATHKCLKPQGSTSPLLYILGSTPDKLDDKKGKVFSSTISSRVVKILKDNDADFSTIRLNNALGCLPNREKIEDSELKCCATRALDDIKASKPRVILALGEEALRVLWPNGFNAIYTISRTRGGLVPYVLDGEIIGVVPSLSPQFANKMENFEQVWIDDILLALDASLETELFKEEKELNVFSEPSEIIHVKNVELVKQLFTELQKAKVVAFDFETTSLHPWKLRDSEKVPELYSVAFAFDNKVYALPLLGFWSKAMEDTIIDSIGKWFIEVLPDQIKVGHNIKFDLLWGLVKTSEHYTKKKAHELALTGIYHDTNAMAWILDERPSMSKLKIAGWKYLGKSDWSIEVKDIFRYSRNDVLQYNSYDSWYTLQLYRLLYPRIQASAEYKNVYENVILPATFAFIQIESRGCLVEEETRLAFAEKLDKEANVILSKIKEETGNPNLNPASPKQLADYFVNDCHYQLLKKNKTGWSVDAATLEHVATEYDDRAAKMILEMRSINKLNGTYISGLADKIYEDGRLHAGFNLTGTVTGRTSSNDPNLQNFPKRKHKEVRQIITVPEGYTMLSLDLGQIEARLFGVMTGDPKFIEALWEKYDIHLENSRILFGDDLAKEKRGVVKNATFAMIYGGGNQKVAETAGVSIEEIQALRELFFTKFKNFKIWQKDTASFERRNGYVESLFGKRRRAPMSYNEMLNHASQSSASDMCITAMVQINRRYDVMFTIHDDITIQVEEDKVEDAIMYMTDCMLTVPWVYMRNSRWLKKYVPLGIEASVGKTWGTMEDIIKIDSIDLGYTSLGKAITKANSILHS